MPFKPGNFFAARTAAVSSMLSPVMMQPDCAPFSRSRRVSLRVSMSAIATTLQRSRKLRQRLGGAPVRVQQGQIADHEARRVDRARFEILGRGAGVADVRIGQRDDLPAVRGIREDLLVAGHRRIENYFTRRVASCAD